MGCACGELRKLVLSLWFGSTCETRGGNSCFSGGALLVVLSGMTQAKERTLLSAAEYARIGRVVSQLCDRASYPALDRLPGSRLGLAY